MLGGFLPNRGSDAGAGAPPRQYQQGNRSAGKDAGESGPRDSRKMTIIPVTILMINNARLDDGKYFLEDDVPVEFISICGRVISKEDDTNQTTFLINDTTGVAAFKVRKPNNVTPKMLANFVYTENMYLYGVAQIQQFQREKVLVLQNFSPVNDFNNVTYHILSVNIAYAQRKNFRKRNSEPVAEEEKVPFQRGGTTQTYGAPNYRPALEQSRAPQARGGGGAMDIQPPQPSRNLSDVDYVREAVRLHADNNTVDFDRLLKFASSRLNPNQLRKILEILAGQGEVFSIDERYWGVM
eukprot:TRINITY_DN1538_c0_g1_i1.p1 TRINITY_DN1538_c0_g1~~TRINITY_DN1538_c0_g1_i1.p1  ORF type:complete len:296 (-),score=65.71 TRINITY_DN1538_c0_g1_i1:136-1023(-)